MNKLFIGLLIIAAGAGVFFFLRKKKNETANNEIKKELIVGKWKMDSIDVRKIKDSNSLFMFVLISTLDSNLYNYQYDFRPDHKIISSLPHSQKADTIQYEWKNSNQIIWKEMGDTTGEILTLIKLNKDSLQMQSKDSLSILFTKLK